MRADQRHSDIIGVNPTPYSMAWRHEMDPSAITWQKNDMIKHITYAFLLATSATAESPMTGAEFDAYVTGRIMSFGTEGDPTFGVEQYLPDRRVIWSTGNGECTHGVWYESKGDICFRYDGDPEPKCWAIYEEGDGIRAVFTTRPDTTVIFETTDFTVPLVCGDLSS